MNTPALDLVCFLREAGFTLTAQGDDLFVEPRENLSPAECDQIRTLKPGIMAILAGERWAECRTCRAGVDAGCPADVARVCGRSACPYRPHLTLRRPAHPPPQKGEVRHLSENDFAPDLFR